MTYLESAESHRDEDDELDKGTIACRRGIIYYERGEIEKGLHEACTAYRILRTSDEHREVANSQLLIANCYARMGKTDEAEEYFLDALSSYRRISDTIGESYVLNNLGLFQKNACRWGRALHFLRKALEICEEVGLTQHRVRVTLNMGIVHLKRHDYDSAKSMFATARGMARRIGDDLKYTRSTIMLGVTEIKIGKLVHAEKHLLDARVLAERRSYRREIALADEFIGDLMVERGDYKSAMENYTISLSEAKKIAPEDDIEAEVLRRMAHLRYLQKKYGDALALGERALKVADKCGELHEIGFVLRTVAQTYTCLKKYEKADKYFNRSIRTFIDINNPYESNQSRRSMAESLLKRKDRRSLIRAKKLLNEALSYFEKIEELKSLAGSHFILARIEKELDGRDECLLHMYEAQMLAEELSDRNLLRRLKRMRSNLEDEVAQISMPSASRIIEHVKMPGSSSGKSCLLSYLDRVLNDLMRRLTVGHGFVALWNGGNGNGNINILAKRGILETRSKELTDWFLGREGVDLTESFVISDTLNDRRSAAIRRLLPEERAPVYFHPMCRNGKPFGLLFFQSEATDSLPPSLGSAFDIVTTYASLLSFLFMGLLGDRDPTKDADNGGETNFQRVITQNEKMLKILSLAERVAGSDSTVLLMGETGTGKGLIAQAIHRLSPRCEGKFIHVNCAALPENILESELFGHMKGSFTGAIADKKGLLAEASGGTIFLDEIGKTSLPLQGKLLQFLDTNRVRPVGSNEMYEVDVRLIFASKVDLLALCRAGKMLEDFYYRINDFPLTIPPLRDRVEDIRLLADHYLSLYSSKMDKRILGFSDDALAHLVTREWRGNVRELEKIVKRAIVLSEENGFITPAELAYDLVSGAPEPRNERPSLPRRIKELEKNMISESLTRNSWNRRVTAEELGISYPTLLKKIQAYKLLKSD